MKGKGAPGGALTESTTTTTDPNRTVLVARVDDIEARVAELEILANIDAQRIVADFGRERLARRRKALIVGGSPTAAFVAGRHRVLGHEDDWHREHGS